MPLTPPWLCLYVTYQIMFVLGPCLQEPSPLWSCLPLRDLDSNSVGLRHFVDKVLDIEPSQVEWQHIKTIVRDHAWNELPTVMQFKVRPAFECVMQYFFLPQSDGKVCLLKHVQITSDKVKVKGAYIKTLLQGQGHKLQWGGANKKLARKGFQWLLEQLVWLRISGFSITFAFAAIPLLLHSQYVRQTHTPNHYQGSTFNMSVKYPSNQ